MIDTFRKPNSLILKYYTRVSEEGGNILYKGRPIPKLTWMEVRVWGNVSWKGNPKGKEEILKE